MTPDLPFDPAKTPDPHFVVPDLAHAVEGWRVWRCALELPRFQTPKLYSATHVGYYWIPKRSAVAECGSCTEENVPGEQCTCGFYSAKTFDHLMTMHYHTYDIDQGEVMILGQTANWGKVVEGTQGWRSAKSYPVRLYVPFEAHRLVEPIRKAYGVPVTLRNFLKPAKGVM